MSAHWLTGWCNWTVCYLVQSSYKCCITLYLGKQKCCIHDLFVVKTLSNPQSILTSRVVFNNNVDQPRGASKQSWNSGRLYKKIFLWLRMFGSPCIGAVGSFVRLWEVEGGPITCNENILYDFHLSPTIQRSHLKPPSCQIFVNPTSSPRYSQHLSSSSNGDNIICEVNSP